MFRRIFFEKLFQCQFRAHFNTLDKNITNSKFLISCANQDALHCGFVIPMRYKSTSKLDHSKVPKLNENDLVEQFVRGSGPGGQAIAKTNNAVVLKHLPTGIVVKCHETRSLWENKRRAREILITKLDNMINGEDSLENQERAFLAKKSANKTRKREKMLALKTAFKEREGIE